MIDIESQILTASGALAMIRSQKVQSLWSGYGEIRRFVMKGGKYPSLIAKHIRLPQERNHPRGWNSDLSHQRKLKSYQVEKRWYQDYAVHVPALSRLPRVYKVIEKAHELLLIMEDLNASGYPIRKTPDTVSFEEAKDCLAWLAVFHAFWINQSPDGLWDVGTYWHLDTRPDEWERMENQELKKYARDIDRILKEAQFQTVVHGDAKLANFCFGPKRGVAAVDFQYVGRGCGMKDVAYFISSCCGEDDCEQYADILLEHYFDQLEAILDNNTDFQLLKDEWMRLYAFAWADLYRFLDGWSPGHWKLHGYSERKTNEALESLK
jgi:thiamine kinase-like enzyme